MNQQQNARLRNAGFATFFFSGICAISAGVVVSLLQEEYGFAYGMTGTLLSLMSVGNLLAGLLIGMLPSVLGMKPRVLLLTIGYAVGYAIMGLTGAEILLALAFFMVGIVGFGGKITGEFLMADIMLAFLEEPYEKTPEHDALIAKIDACNKADAEVQADPHFFDEFLEKWDRGEHHD